MRIKRGQMIAGLPVKVVRDFLRRRHTIHVSEFVDLTEDGGSPEQVVADIAAAGYLEPEPGLANCYRASVAGRRLRNASLLKPISREKADQLFEGFMDRVAEVNRRDELTHVVNEVRVFGSYIRATPDFGDIDLALRLRRRVKDFEEFRRMNEARVDAAGRWDLSHSAWIRFGQREVRRILKNRSPYLSIHDLDDLEDIKAPSRLVFKGPKRMAHFGSATGGRADESGSAS